MYDNYNYKIMSCHMNKKIVKYIGGFKVHNCTGVYSFVPRRVLEA